jgi:hypothetical protein
MRQDRQVADPRKSNLSRPASLDRVHVVLRDDLAALGVALERRKFDKRFWRDHDARGVHPTMCRAQPSIFLPRSMISFTSSRLYTSF